MAKKLKRDLDLLAAYSYEKTFFEKNKILVIIGGAGAVAVTVALVFFLVIFIQNMSTRADIRDLENQMTELQTQIAVAEADPDAIAYNQYKSEMTYLNSISDQVFNEELKQDVLMSIDSVTGNVSIRSIGYTQATSTIELSVTAGDKNIPPQLITSLKNTGKFSSVTYSGWSSSDSSVSVNVSLVISQPGGSEDE